MNFASQKTKKKIQQQQHLKTAESSRSQRATDILQDKKQSSLFILLRSWEHWPVMFDAMQKNWES